jgi:hypothetical protein
VVISFICGGNWSTRRKQATCHELQVVISFIWYFSFLHK